MRCLKCEVALSPLQIGNPPTDDDRLIRDGGELTVAFGYGSTHDCTTARAFVCDGCFSRHRHLFEQAVDNLPGNGSWNE